MYKLFIRIICLFILATKVACVFASPNLYNDVVIVKDQTDTARNVAFTTALSDVLIKISGNNTIVRNPVVMQAVKQAPQWVQSYQYSNSPLGLLLNMQFDPQQINQLFTQAKQPLWQGTRPKTLTWVVQNNSEAQLEGSGSNSLILDNISLYAQQHGLQVLYPLLDIQDLAVISPKAIVEYQPDVIRQASARYPHDEVLLVTITPPADDKAVWQANWSLLATNAKMDWSSQGGDMATAIRLGMAQFAANVFVQPQIQAFVPNQQISLTVYGVNSLQTYNQVNRYLQQLSGIQTMKVATLANDHVIFNITLDESAENFNQFLTKSNILLPADGNNLENLIYRVNS